MNKKILVLLGMIILLSSLAYATPTVNGLFYNGTANNRTTSSAFSDIVVYAGVGNATVANFPSNTNKSINISYGSGDFRIRFSENVNKTSPLDTDGNWSLSFNVFFTSLGSGDFTMAIRHDRDTPDTHGFFVNASGGLKYRASFGDATGEWLCESCLNNQTWHSVQFRILSNDTSKLYPCVDNTCYKGLDVTTSGAAFFGDGTSFIVYDRMFINNLRIENLSYVPVAPPKSASVTNVSITPINPINEDDLNGICAGSNNFNYSLFFEWKWYNNTVEHSSGVNNNTNYSQNTNYVLTTLNYTNTDLNQNWTFSCRANANNTYSDWKNSTTIDIKDFALDNCTNYNTTVLNFTAYDETNLGTIYLNLTGAFRLRSALGIERNFTLSLNNTNHFQICVFPDTQYNLDAYLQHESSGQIQQRFYLNNITVNSTIQQVDIYNFETDPGVSELTGIVKDQIYDEKAGTIVKMQHYYPEKDSWITVQIDQSDEFGKTIFYIIQNEEDYRFIFNENGEEIYRTSSVKFACDSATECEQTFVLYDQEGSIEFENMGGGITFNNDTKIITLTWSDPDNTASSVRLLVEKQATDQVITICNTRSTSSSGSINCNISGYNGYVSARAFRSASPDSPWIIELIEITGTKLYNVINSNDGMVLSAFVTIALIGFGAGTSSPLVVVLMSLSALIFVFLTEINSIINLSIVISGFAVAMIAAYMLRDR